jgi:predicted double-glycine peptidase
MLTALASLMASPAAGGEIEAPRGSKPVLSLQEIRSVGVVRQKWDISCGAAALATLLTYQHGDSVPEVEVAKTMLQKTNPLRVKVRQGFSLLDVKRFVDERGYEGSGYTGLTLKDLVDMAPLIIPIEVSRYPHFVIFRGIENDRVVLADPAFGNRTMKVAAFLDVWPETIGFVVERRDGRPPPNRLNPQPGDLVIPLNAAVRTALLP